MIKNKCTPIVELKTITKDHNLNTKIFAKLESFNFAGSTKDRVARQMIEDAEKKGIIAPGYTIIEPTSGNTGIGLAAIAKNRGYKCIIVMPDSMSKQRQNLITKYDAKLVLTDGNKGMKGSINKAKEMFNSTQNAWIAGQFENSSNWKAHYNTTGPEIWDQTNGKIDVFIAGIGTGGTITGVGRYLKEKNSKINIIGVEPANSAVLNGRTAGRHAIQGIGAGFVPKILDTKIYDNVIEIADDEAIRYYNYLNNTEKYSAGISSGAALCAAIKFAKNNLKVKNIVILCPDGKDRYQ